MQLFIQFVGHLSCDMVSFNLIIIAYFVTTQHQAVTWVNTDISKIRPCLIHLTVISCKMSHFWSNVDKYCIEPMHHYASPVLPTCLGCMQGSFHVCTQPMRDNVIMSRRLALAGGISKMISVHGELFSLYMKVQFVCRNHYLCGPWHLSGLSLWTHPIPV